MQVLLYNKQTQASTHTRKFCTHSAAFSEVEILPFLDIVLTFTLQMSKADFRCIMDLEQENQKKYDIFVIALVFLQRLLVLILGGWFL